MKTRDIGIDCVKLLAIVFVILHHIVDCGLTMSDTAGNGLRTAWYFLHSISLTCVDLFAIITGYLCVVSHASYKRLFNLWLQVLFIGIAITGIGFLAGVKISAYDWLKAFFPVVTGEYWYFTAYFIVFLFIPFINPGAQALDKQVFWRLLLAFFVLFGTASLFVPNDPFVLKKGYCFAWLLVLYFFGAYWRLHIVNPPKRAFVWLFLPFVPCLF